MVHERVNPRRVEMERDAAKEIVWREKIAEYEKSGLTVREYCLKNGLRECQFFYWRRALKGNTEKKATGFVELVRAGVSSGKSGVSIRIGERVSMVLERGFDRDTLRAALAVVCEDWKS
jgi:transposase